MSNGCHCSGIFRPRPPIVGIFHWEIQGRWSFFGLWYFSGSWTIKYTNARRHHCQTKRLAKLPTNAPAHCDEGLYSRRPRSLLVTRTNCAYSCQVSVRVTVFVGPPSTTGLPQGVLPVFRKAGNFKPREWMLSFGQRPRHVFMWHSKVKPTTKPNLYILFDLEDIHKKKFRDQYFIRSRRRELFFHPSHVVGIKFRTTG